LYFGLDNCFVATTTTVEIFFSIEAELVDEYEDELRDARFLQE
jgi:hypothetical protein